jgi:hypothetical protein
LRVGTAVFAVLVDFAVFALAAAVLAAVWVLAVGARWRGGGGG